MKQKQTGFTLIEILVVVAIIGMIGVVVLTALSTVRAKGRDSRRKADMVQIQKALELYYNTNNRYPCTGTYNATNDTCTGYVWYGAGSGGCGGTHTTTGASGYIPDLAPTHVVVLPTDPMGAGTGCAGYNYISNGTSYKILSNRVGSVGPESFPAAGQQFYDPARPTTAWMLCSAGSTTACNTW